ncbi:MAG TPA: hypothetical protein VFF73_38495 [Planctomycetota bacterium]|nr:hypothetical protein [Planctomycetota bacterium]
MLRLDTVLGREEREFVAAISDLGARFPEGVVRLALDPERLVALVRAVRDAFPERFGSATDNRGSRAEP